MENSAIEAIIIGVSVLVFVIAITISVNLFINVMKMSDTANNIMKTKETPLTEIDEEQERTISGRDLILYEYDDAPIGQLYVNDGISEKPIDDVIKTSEWKNFRKKEYKIKHKENDKFLFE